MQSIMGNDKLCMVQKTEGEGGVTEQTFIKINEIMPKILFLALDLLLTAPALLL